MIPLIRVIAVALALLLCVVLVWTSVGSVPDRDEMSNGGEFTGWSPTQQELDELNYPPGPVPPEFWQQDVNWTQVSMEKAPPSVPEREPPETDGGAAPGESPCGERTCKGGSA